MHQKGGKGKSVHLLLQQNGPQTRKNAVHSHTLGGAAVGALIGRPADLQQQPPVEPVALPVGRAAAGGGASGPSPAVLRGGGGASHAGGWPCTPTSPPGPSRQTDTCLSELWQEPRGEEPAGPFFSIVVPVVAPASSYKHHPQGHSTLHPPCHQGGGESTPSAPPSPATPPPLRVWPGLDLDCQNMC